MIAGSRFFTERKAAEEIVNIECRSIEYLHGCRLILIQENLVYGENHAKNRRVFISFCDRWRRIFPDRDLVARIYALDDGDHGRYMLYVYLSYGYEIRACTALEKMPGREPFHHTVRVGRWICCQYPASLGCLGLLRSVSQSVRTDLRAVLDALVPALHSCLVSVRGIEAQAVPRVSIGNSTVIVLDISIFHDSAQYK